MILIPATMTDEIEMEGGKGTVWMLPTVDYKHDVVIPDKPLGFFAKVSDSTDHSYEDSPSKPKNHIALEAMVNGECHGWKWQMLTETGKRNFKRKFKYSDKVDRETQFRILGETEHQVWLNGITFDSVSSLERLMYTMTAKRVTVDSDKGIDYAYLDGQKLGVVQSV